MTLAQEYERLIKEFLMDSCEEALDKLEEFEKKNRISHGSLEGSGWSCNTRIFKDASIYGYSCLYRKQFDFFTVFQH